MDDIIPVAPIDTVVARAAADRVVAAAAIQFIVAALADDRVVAAATVDVIVAGAAVDCGSRQHAIVQADPVVSLIAIDHDRGHVGGRELEAVLVDLHVEHGIDQRNLNAVVFRRSRDRQHARVEHGRSRCRGEQPPRFQTFQEKTPAHGAAAHRSP
jgi:hypothetical protein